MSNGKTSRPAKHLRLVHNLSSAKTEVEITNKRKRDAEVEKLRASPLFANNPRRLNLLLETLRIVNKNLPLRAGEYDESKLIEALVVKADMQTTVNAQRVKEVIIELYRSTKSELIEYLAENREHYPNFTLCADFRTCKTTGEKYLGKFNPAYGDREDGIQKPSRSWLTQTLEAFTTSPSDFYGSTSDAGGYVKYMLRFDLKLKWEWCFAPLAHAATKVPCGLGGNTSRAASPEMADLITKMTQVITQVKLVTTTDDLFAELCKSKTTGASTRLVGYSVSRFLDMTNAMRRVLDKWPAVVTWYEERGRRALRNHNPPSSFPLESRQKDLIQVLSIFEPIAELKFKCQAERAEQVNALMALYMSRLDELGQDQPVRHCQATYEDPQWISASALTTLASKNRNLLREALDKRVFSRYYKDSQFEQSHSVLEMMVKLHPIYKNTVESLNRIVVKCCRQHGKTEDKL